MTVLRKKERSICISQREWAVMTKRLYEVAGKVFGRALYEGGQVKGKELVKKYGVKKDDLKQLQEVIKKEGLARNVEIHDREILVEGSFEGEALKPYTRPVCFYLAGIIATIYSKIEKEDVKVEETDCISTGKKVCRFVVRPLEWYEKMNEVMEII